MLGMCFGGSGVLWYSIGALIDPLRASFGWSNANVSGWALFVAIGGIVGLCAGCTHQPRRQQTGQQNDCFSCLFHVNPLFYCFKVEALLRSRIRIHGDSDWFISACQSKFDEILQQRPTACRRPT